MKLRTKSCEELIRILDRSIFTSHAFETDFSSQGTHFVKIVYRDQPDFAFEVSESSSSSSTSKSGQSHFQIEVNPGEQFIDGEVDTVRDIVKCCG